MRHDQPEMIDALAAQYVLGTLRGAARRRFERWSADNRFIAQRVQTWEGRLMPLTLGLAPLAPSPEVWRAIETRISAQEASGPAPPRRTALRALAAAIVLCVVAAGGYFAWQASLALQLAPVATISAPKGGPAVWSIELDAKGEKLRAVALPGAAARAGHSFELWALPRANGGAPVSLGVLPESGQLDRTLTASQKAALSAATQIAVTLEPSGGSPTGAPTGPVLYVAPLKKNV